MVVLWLAHRAVIVLLVVGGLHELAQVSTVATVATVLFLIFATMPVAGWRQERADMSATVPRR